MNRHIRLAEQIRQEVGDILTRKVHDPGIGLLTLTRAVVSTDLLNARVYYTMLGGPDDQKKTARALDRAVPFIRRTLGERLSLRRVPELAFQFDDGAASLGVVILSVVAGALVAYGAAFGGSLVFDDAFNVESQDGSTVWDETERDELPADRAPSERT